MLSLLFFSNFFLLCVQVVEAGARSLKTIFQSAYAPKCEMFMENRMELMLNLLNDENETVSEVAACVLARCCETSEQQAVLADAGGTQRLVGLLEGTLKKREAALDALAALTKGNKHLSTMLICMDAGNALAAIVRFVKDKSSRSRLLSCMCLANVAKVQGSSYRQDWELRVSMVATLVKLFDEIGPVGEEAPCVLADLIESSEGLQKAAFDVNAVDKLVIFLVRGAISARHLEGVLMALAELCSRLEECRRRLAELQVSLRRSFFFTLSLHGMRQQICSLEAAAVISEGCWNFPRKIVHSWP